jgi:hypothetical protein
MRSCHIKLIAGILVVLIMLVCGLVVSGGRFFFRRAPESPIFLARQLHLAYISCLNDSEASTAESSESAAPVTIERLVADGYLDTYLLDRMKPYIVVLHQVCPAERNPVVIELFHRSPDFLVTCTLSGKLASKKFPAK